MFEVSERFKIVSTLLDDDMRLIYHQESDIGFRLI